MRRRTLVAPEWSDRLAQAGLPDLAVLLDRQGPPGLPGDWHPLTKPGLGGRERWRWASDGTGGGILYLKRYLRTPVREQMDRLRRQRPLHSRAWWEFRQSAELAQHGVPAVRAVAVVEQLFGPWEQRSAVLFEPAPGDALDCIWPRLVAQRAAVTHGRPRHDLVRDLARIVSAFHQTGLCHRDLYLCHVFADLDPDARRPPRFTLIDLARTHRPRLRRLRWIIKDLSQLDCSARQIGASRTDRLRFLAAYLGIDPGSPRIAWYVRRILRKSTRILHRIARRSGPP